MRMKAKAKDDMVWSDSNLDGRTLIVIDNIAQMVTASIMSLAHTHGVVSEVYIAVVAWMVSMRLEKQL